MRQRRLRRRPGTVATFVPSMLNTASGYPLVPYGSLYSVQWIPNQEVVRIHVADGKRESVADLKGVQHTGVYTFWMGLDLRDTPMMLRDLGTDDIYSLTLESK